VVFACQNNQWSISVPLSRQTAVKELAEKGAAYGIPSRSIDGNDLNAVYEATAEAVQQARSGGGPRFLELVTYRLGAHSSSDDPTRYRNPKEVERWLLRDPIASGKKWMIGQDLWSEAKDKALRKKMDAEIVAAIAQAETLPRPEADTLFDDLYAEPPWILAEQREMLRGELAAAPRVRP
jgi:TPP-dependent pyruvate/acetoin dehydrogenase alpha subunit